MGRHGGLEDREGAGGEFVFLCAWDGGVSVGGGGKTGGDTGGGGGTSSSAISYSVSYNGQR